MQRYLRLPTFLSGMLIIILVLIVACGEEATDMVAPVATAAPGCNRCTCSCYSGSGTGSNRGPSGPCGSSRNSRAYSYAYSGACASRNACTSHDGTDRHVRPLGA